MRPGGERVEWVSRWMASVCVVAVLCTLLQRLFPDTGLGRQGRLLLPCLFLCAFLSPLGYLKNGAEWPTFPVTEEVDSAALESRLRQQMIAQVSNALLDMANQALESYGFSAKKVVTDMDIDEEGCIHMGQITVYVDEDTARHSAAVKQIVEQRLGATVVLARWEEQP